MRVSILVVLFSFPIIGFGQMLKPAMKGIGSMQGIGFYNVKFKVNGPLGKDWMYGSYLDEDSLTRCVAYREGGKWVPLPFSGYYGNEARDMEMWGDTLCVFGGFGSIILDKDSSSIPNSNILKFYGDSIWSGDTNVVAPLECSTKGDSLIVRGASYYNPPQQLIYSLFMTPDGGSTWQYPFGIKHPTDTSQFPSFGPPNRIEILENGDVLIINDDSPDNTPYNGVLRWDGAQWHTYGDNTNAFKGAKVYDFEFFKDELYIGGNFAKYYTYYGDTTGWNLKAHGNSIVKWNGNSWEELGGGIIEGGVLDIIIHDSIVYCQVNGGSYKYHQFGDALIPCFAGWDGQQWCGTPIGFDNDATKPMSFGFVNDTLFMAFQFTGPTNTVDGQRVSSMMYFDGDYLHGPNSICSTPGLGEEKVAFTNEEVKVYPNPVKDELHVSLPDHIKEATYQLMALDGKLVKEGKLKAGGNTLTVSEKLNGVFLLKLSSFGGEIVRKVVFEN